LRRFFHSGSAASRLAARGGRRPTERLGTDVREGLGCEDDAVADAGLHVDWLGAGERVLLVHGSFVAPDAVWTEQRPLARDFRLGIVHRRGYGASPDPDGRVDFEADGADLARLLDAAPAHVVAHSYGGLGAVFAAAARPGALRSLTLIEPPALALAPADDAVRELQDRLVGVFARSSDPRTLYADFIAAWGFDRPTDEELAEQDARALVSSATERPPWEVELPVRDLAAAGVPTLVVRGDWSRAPVAARRLAGHAYAAVCDVLERELGAERLIMAGSSHTAQRAGPPFNDALRAFLYRRAAARPARVS
jgi:pimeloyl-ACP methyl ester carboxylesterase